ncbi:MAG: alpha/beta fold hydrolase [Pseudomonadota bacterium]
MPLARHFVTLGRGMLTALGFAMIPGLAAADCGPVPGPCELPDGTYHIELPEPANRPMPALVFLHGWGSRGEGTLTMRGMVESARARGYAVIAPDGVLRQSGNGRTWTFRPGQTGPRDDIAFLQSVRDDAVERHGIDPEKVVLAGFSIGGSMTSYVACAAPDAFSAYAPVAGSFWRPHPAECAGPVNLLHTHGWRDGTVPLTGRILRGGEDPDDPGTIAQGDVWHAMSIWRASNGCRPNANDRRAEDIYWRADWTTCSSGAVVGFALHEGGHGIPQGWAELALTWFEAL